MKPRILYADDDETSRLAIARLLEQEGYDCVGAADGHVGAQCLNETEFDCVISDLNMQGNANMEFIHSVDRLRPGIPVIITTGYPSLETAYASFQLPVIAYLTKPLSFSDLLQHVREGLVIAALKRQVEQMRTSLNARLGDLALADQAIVAAPRKAFETPVAAFMGIAYRNVLDSVAALRTVVEYALPTSLDNSRETHGPGHSPMLLMYALLETVAVLEKTKDAFRSRDLGNLRKRLEKLLESEVGLRQNN